MLQFFRGQKRRVMAAVFSLLMLLTLIVNDSAVLAEDMNLGDTNGDSLVESTLTTEVLTQESATTLSLTSEDLTEGTYKSTFIAGGFTITASETKLVSIDTNNKTADDGTSFTKRIKLGGTGDSNNRSIHFTTAAEAMVKIYAMSSSSDSDRNLSLFSVDGTEIGSVSVYGASLITATIPITNAGDYYLASPSSGVNVYGIIVTTTGEEPEVTRKDWNLVTAPVVNQVEQSDGKIIVTFDLVTGDDGADKATVYMQDETKDVIDSVLVGRNTTQTLRTAEFIPNRSGTYSFLVVAERTDEITVKESNIWEDFNYLLPLKAPVIKGINNIGNGSVEITWEDVPEVENYIIYYQMDGAEENQQSSPLTNSTGTIDDLTIGVSYWFSVEALRGEDKSLSERVLLTITSEEERPWYFSAYGPGVNTENNYFSRDEESNEVIIASENGKGKLQPTSTDGLAYYYTSIDPMTENFILSGMVTVDTWTFSNGQEGFGIMACDAVGMHGDSSVFWNNSYMLGAMKVEYFWDTVNNQVSDAGEKIVMKQGIGAQEKVGVTASNIADGTIVSNIKELFRSTMTTMETSGGVSGAGTYNIIGNFSNLDPPTGTVDTTKLKTTFQFKLLRDNTGYRLSYTDEKGNTVTKLYHDISRNALTQIDEENIYVGFFASRNARISVTDIELHITDPATDPLPEEQEITYVTPKYQVISSHTSAVEDYNLIFTANADGILTIKGEGINDIATNEVISAGMYHKYSTALTKGNNSFYVEFTPNSEYKPSEFERLSSYDKVTFEHSVMYKEYEQPVLYIGTEGTSEGAGTKNNPLDIYTAVQYARPGQILVLQGGIYNLNHTVTIDRGINGTENKLIYLVADEDSNNRPVLNFNSVCAGVVLAGDYWYLKGFDVTKSADATKGLQISGSHNIVDGVNTYLNGNTGLQISRYLSTDGYEDWPSNNFILNCTSYGNADRGYEDADGFAAKLTVGEGNVFDGCIAYNNADDGWDLFAKVETGPIGQVVVKNSVAYGNGYLPDGTNAGNGNGFKLGGSSITGYHKLINSVAFDNKAKGIDSNSCPDIQIYQCTTFNNGSYNVALYTNDAPNTDFLAEGVLSYRTSNLEINENIKPKGIQDTSKIYGENNYYWDALVNRSVNSVNASVADSWFNHMDTDIVITRNNDGTIQMNGLLVLTDIAVTNVGARIGGTPSLEIEIPENNANPVTPTPTVAPTPTPIPNPPYGDKDIIDAKEVIAVEVANEKELRFTLPQNQAGNVPWDQAVLLIKENLDKYVKNEANSKLYLITIDMKEETVLPKELISVLAGRNVNVVLIMKEGVSWTLKGSDILKEGIKNVDLSVTLNTVNIPPEIKSQLIDSSKAKAYMEFSLAHNGEFGFTATLSLDLSKHIDLAKMIKDKEDITGLMAGVYYYNKEIKSTTLQAASIVEKGYISKFTFTHASDYMLLLEEELFIDEDTLSQVTVNDKKSTGTGILKLYAKGTRNKTKEIIVKIPAHIQQMIDQNIITYGVSYSSSNKSVAGVSAKGIISAVNKGTAVITTKISINSKILIFKTQVTVEKARVVFVKTNQKLVIDKTITYEIKLYGYAAKDIEWMTSKKRISIVYKNTGKTKAVVYGVSTGTEEIYIRLINKKGYLAKTKITVINSSK